MARRTRRSSPAMPFLSNSLMTEESWSATRWVVRFLQNEESLIRLVELHRPVPLPALERSVPRLVSLFDGVEEAAVREAWQRAIALLCLVLVAAAREDARSSVV